jgi:hypothetical protein
MKTIGITADQYYSKLDVPHNPPAPEISDDAFEVEFGCVHERLSKLLADLGTNDPFGQADYHLDYTVMRSRGIGFEITNEDFLTSELLSSMQNILKENAPNWEFSISIPGGGLFVSADVVLAHNINRPE